MRNVSRNADDGSMALAMLVAVVSLGLSTLLASIVAASLVGARVDVQSVRAVNAAHAGLNIGVARVMKLRAAPVGASGDCALDGAAGSGQYHVTLGFYTGDPNTAVCVFDKSVHRYARITAVGSDGPGGRTRTLVATYAFTLGDVQRPAGGRLVFNDATDGTCMTRLFRLAGCDPGAANQRFVYGTDLTLAHVDTATLRADCVTADSGNLAMLPCDPNDTDQQWSFNGRTFVTAATSCLDSAGGQGSLVLLATGARCPASTGSTPTWQPDASLGAGYASSAASGEIVNGNRFAACLSTVATVVTCGQSALTPGTTGPWAITAVAGTPYVSVASALNCLTTSPIAGAAVSMRTCSSGDPTQRWSAPAVGETWEASFRMRDVYGQCLTASTNLFDPYSAAVVTTPCSPSAAQKWNVDTNAFSPALINIEQR